MFSKTKYIDICQYHNQTYDFLHAISDKVDYLPKILINFDLHSDVKCNKRPRRIRVSNWANWAINHYSIDEYYWVIPKSILNDNQMQEHCFGKINNIEKKTALYGNFTNNNYEYSPTKCLKQTFMLDKETNNIIAEYAHLPKEAINKIINENKNYSMLNVYTCTEDNLPNFHNKDIILTIDGDYFTNNGYDTYFNYKYDTDDINLLFEKFIKCLENKHINPLCLSFSMSKNYSLHHEELINFYNTLYDKCPNKQNIDIQYIHTDLTDDPYIKLLSINFDKINDKFIKISVNHEIESENQIKEYISKEAESQIEEYISKKFINLEDGCYNFLTYAKEVVNKKNNEIQLLVYPDDQELIKYSY